MLEIHAGSYTKLTGRFRLDIRENSISRVCGTAQAPQGVLTCPRLPELQECWDKAPRDAQGGILRCPVQGLWPSWVPPDSEYSTFLGFSYSWGPDPIKSHLSYDLWDKMLHFWGVEPQINIKSQLSNDLLRNSLRNEFDLDKMFHFYGVEPQIPAEEWLVARDVPFLWGKAPNRSLTWGWRGLFLRTSVLLR